MKDVVYVVNIFDFFKHRRYRITLNVATQYIEHYNTRSRMRIGQNVKAHPRNRHYPCKLLPNIIIKSEAVSLVVWFLFMMTSSNENISALLVLCDGNLLVTSGFPHNGQLRGALTFYAWTAIVPEQTVEQTIETALIWDAIAPIVTSL